MLTEELLQQEVAGLFDESINRNFKQIREDRAQLMKKGTRTLYKREIDDLYVELETLEVDQNNLLDFAGTSTTKIISPSDFDSKVFVAKDKEFAMKAREIRIQIEEYSNRFQKLFGTPYKREA